MAYTKTQWVNNEEPSIDADNLNKMEQGIYDAQFPDGGTAGQLLAKTANGKAWVDAPNSAVWGLIQGTLSNQTDLATALENTGKVDTVNGISPDANKNVQVDVELTQAQYDALPSSKTSDDVNYFIKDGQPNPTLNTISATGVSYNNSTSGLNATNVQSAVDENASAIDELKNDLLNSTGISANSSITYATTGGTRFILFTIGTNTNVQGIVFGAVNNANDSIVQSTLSANTSYGITCSFSSGVLTVRNGSSNYALVRVVLLAGSLI